MLTFSRPRRVFRSLREDLAGTRKEKAKGQLHKAFEPSFGAKPVYTPAFLYPKIAYIHHDPVSEKWSLCNEFTDYTHSSAAFYELAQPHPFVNITDYRDYWFWRVSTAQRTLR